MIKKPIVFLALILLLISAAGCANEPAPENKVESLVVAMKEFDLYAIAKVFDPELEITEDEWQDMQEQNQDVINKLLGDYYRTNAEKIEHEILKVELDSEDARVLTRFRYVNGAPLMKGILIEMNSIMTATPSPVADLSPEEGVEKVARIFTDIIEEKVATLEDEDMIEVSVEFHLILKEGQWYFEEIPVELLNVMYSNHVQALEEVGEEMMKEL